MPRVEEAHPLGEKDQIYRVIMFPAVRWAKEEKRRAKKKTERRKIDRLVAAMYVRWHCPFVRTADVLPTCRHIQCEYLHEDRAFLLECFDNLAQHCDLTDMLDQPALSEGELATWIEVLSGGVPPTESDVDDVIATLDEYRAKLGADPCDGVIFVDDFFLVTFDYYLAFGQMRMRSLFMDLLLT
eukprot:COSAG01_NODE_129_length_24935_cov_39.324368_21_plen_184_part_00